jgi:hypothetical protein
MDEFDKFKAAVYGQESGNGAVPTDKPNYAGARGKGQILESTFKGLQKTGAIPADYNWSNPAHNEAASDAYMAEAWRAAEADPRKAAAYYYGGPKAIKGGSIVEFGDLKNPKAPTTVQYAEQVAGRMGLPPAGPRPLRPLTAMELGIQRTAIRPHNRDMAAELQEDRLARETTEANMPGFGDIVGAAWDKNTDSRIWGSLKERIWGDEFPAEPGFKPDYRKLDGLRGDATLLEDYSAATSPAAADKVLREFNEERARVTTLMSQGTGLGIAASFGAEIVSPTNWVMALAAPQLLAAKGVGSVAMAAGGASRTAVIASSVAENLIGGTALEATAQLLEGRFNGTDLLISGVADGLLGAGAGTLAHRAGAIARTEGLIQRVNDTAWAQETEAVAKAQAKLGPEATTEQVVAEVKAQRVAEANEPIKQATVADNSLSVESVPVAQADVAPTAAIPEAALVPEGQFDTLEKLVTRKADFDAGGRYEAEILERTGGMIKDLKGLEALGAGVHITPAMLAKHGAAFDTVTKLAKRFLKDTTIVLHSGEVKMPDGVRANADISQVTDKIALVRLDPNLEGAQAVRAAVHEIGHAVFNRHIATVTPEIKAKLLAAFAAFTEAAKKVDGNEARGMRYSVTNPRLKPDLAQSPQVEGKYEINWDELSAEQFGKFIDEDIAGPNRFGLHAKVIQIVKAAIANAIAWLTFAKRADLGVNDAYREFFETLSADPVVAEARKTLTLKKPASTPAAQADTPADIVASILRDPDANRFGLGTAPVATKTERDEVKAILNLHKQAEQKAPALTPEYEKRAQNLADNNVFNVASTGLIMLKSKSPLVRWVAGELLEDASGVQAKRGITAAIKKHIVYRAMMDNAINDFDSAYRFWSKDKPGGFQDNMVGGKNRAEFEKLVTSEIEARRATRAPVTTEPNVKGAADVIEAAFTRTAKAQVDAKTLGSAGLPADSIGYVPHRVSAGGFMALTNEQRQVMHQALVDQFITIEGWDASFSDMLASRYMQRVQDRATGGNGSNIGGNNAGSIDLVEEALKAAQVPADQIKAHMERFKKGAANYTKGRIELDLNKVYTTAGGDFKLLDIFETNPIELLRSQVERASGEVALALKGVQGKPGLDLLRKAMTFGEDGKKASLRELDAFDQVAAELMGEPFGSATPKWMERAMSANTLVRLGGIVYNQISESITGIAHVGAMRTMESVAGIPRLRQEIIALSRGQKVDNPIIGSLEIAGGAEFGTDAYKIVMPYDNPSNTMPTYGQDTLTLTDRLLRGGGHLQAKLSFWRAIHSAQQRGMAEQIVHKALRYIREGKNDIALQQFGITPELQAAMRAELDTIAKFDANGRLFQFDVTKMSDPNMREAFIQAVWRGNSQIIQGTFIGERGKWAHEGVLKMMTQFRTFPIVSMEKQWGRQRNSRGAAAAVGIVLGAMSLAAPIYMARTYASSIGRPDQEAYLEERLQPQHIARAAMNYVAGLGMAPDFIDAVSAVMPDSMSLRPTGGRAAVETDFVGNFIAPAASLADDAWKYLQSPLSLEDATRILPFRNLPLVLPLMNMAKD